MKKKYVLSCINGFPPSLSVIDYGCWLSEKMNSGLKLFHTIDNQYHESVSDLSGSIGLGSKEDLLNEIVNMEHEQNKLLQKKSKLILENGQEHAKLKGIKDIKICSRKGKVLDNILGFKDDVSVSVIGKYGKRHQGEIKDEYPVGHKVEGLIRKVDLPVFIVSEKFKEPKSILLAYDGSEGAKKVLDFICNSLNAQDLKIDLLFIGEDNAENQSLLSEAKAKLENSHFVTASKIISGDPQTELPNYLSTADNDILAMGAFGHGVLHEFFIGSLTAQMIKRSKRPLLLVK